MSIRAAARQFMLLDRGEREAYLREQADQIQLARARMIGKLVAHAAALLLQEYPGATAVTFDLMPGYWEASTVRLTGLTGPDGQELEPAMSHQFLPACSEQAQLALGQAADLGAEFLHGACVMGRRMFLQDPMEGVAWPARAD